MKNLNLVKKKAADKFFLRNKKFKSDSISLTLFRKIDFKKKCPENI